MAGPGNRLNTPSTAGRFDEASQRDVLALAARLQKRHLETVSAEEIEQAAIEGGMNAEFIREAIRRVSTDEETPEELEPQKVSQGEWAVLIVVPTIVFGALFLKLLARETNYRAAMMIGGLLFLALILGLIALAVLGAKYLLQTQRLKSFSAQTASANTEPAAPVTTGYIITHVLAASALVTVPFSGYSGPEAQAWFLAALAPFLGAYASDWRKSFWKGGAVGGAMAIGVAMDAAFHGNGMGNPGLWPILVGGMGATYGLISLFGFGVKYAFETPRRRRKAVDRATLLAQLFDIQATLDRHQESRTFLSVDVVGSSTMKADSNPLEVEFSFGQYQLWISETVRAYGGEVQLAAGDGAMAMFREPANAVLAAKQLQRSIDQFNADKNRLPGPFRIRCGISQGKIGLNGETALGHLQSPVLDRAAFLQKYAEPGSIALSPDLIETAMPLLGSLRQCDLIDGKPVYCWP